MGIFAKTPKAVLDKKAVVGLYTVSDKVAEEFGPPFVAVSDAVAVRQYLVLLQEQHKSVWDDYSLIWLGTWDSEQAIINYGPSRIVMEGAGGTKE